MARTRNRGGLRWIRRHERRNCRPRSSANDTFAGRERNYGLMVDRQKLGTWIQPKHLEETALEGYRSAFAGHPAHLVVIKDFLQPQMADRLSRFLLNEAEFK